MKAKSKTLSPRSEPSNRPILSCSKRSALRPTILKKIPSACDTLNSAHSTCSSAPASSKPAARPSLVPAANSPACSGQYAARTPSSLSAAATSTDALKTTGQTVRWLEFHSHVVHPCPIVQRPRSEADRVFGHYGISPSVGPRVDDEVAFRARDCHQDDGSPVDSQPEPIAL